MKSTAVIAALLLTAQTHAADIEPLITGVIYDRDAAQTATLMEQAKAEPDNAQLQFLAGFCEMLGGAETLLQDIYTHYSIIQNPQLTGGTDEFFQTVGLKPITEESPLSYAESRQILQRFVDALERAEVRYAASAKAGEHTTLIDFSRVSLDIDKDGTNETSYAKILQRTGAPMDAKVDATIAFDLADTYWFQGYANLLGGIGNTFLSYDWSELHYHAFFHLLNTKAPDNPYPYLDEAYEGRGGAFTGSRRPQASAIIDLIAAIHSLQFPLAADGKTRLLKAHRQLMNVPALSRKTMAAVLAETDNNREWIPNPTQTSVTGMELTREQIDGWIQITKQVEQVLDGEKLLPFWRTTHEKRGVNLKKFYTEPMDPLAPIYVIQGALPSTYFELFIDTKKEIINQQFIERGAMLFGGSERFALFSLWFN